MINIYKIKNNDTLFEISEDFTTVKKITVLNISYPHIYIKEKERCIYIYSEVGLNFLFHSEQEANDFLLIKDILE